MPQFFKKTSDFRKWLEQNHETAAELIVGYYKIGTKKESITWPQSVDEALCFGWIDGIRRSVDEESYSVRFTPRRANSIWSAVNIDKIAELTKHGLMRPAGMASYEKRKDEKSKIYSYEKEASNLPDDWESVFKSNKKAWDFFTSQAPGYQKTAIHYVVGAKQEKTRQSRFNTLLEDCENSRKLKQLRR